MTYIDYRKAFDSIPHSYLLEILETYKIDPILINSMQKTMERWTTVLHISDGIQTIQSKEITIKKGIFQGDSLSALWFCVCLNPLSQMLKNTEKGYKLKYTAHRRYDAVIVNHLLYMDDLKLYANSTEQMQQLLEITKTFSQDICMRFGIDKCKAVQLWKGKLINTEGYRISEEEIRNDLTENLSYKYLDFHQLRGIKHTEIKEKLTTVFEKRLRIICKSYLNTANKIKAINTYAIPILTYSFGIISWSNTDLKSLERLVRKTLTNHSMHHPKSAVESPYRNI
jgi:hypothetical protein